MRLTASATIAAMRYEKPRTLPFRKKLSDARLSRESAKRQAEIGQLAFIVLGGREAAACFLNNPHSVLGGRPLAIATASPEGHIAVARTIQRMALSHLETKQ